MNEFYCRAENKCVPDRWKCDGHDDCIDGSDEVSCRKYLPVPRSITLDTFISIKPKEKETFNAIHISSMA